MAARPVAWGAPAIQGVFADTEVEGTGPRCPCVDHWFSYMFSQDIHESQDWVHKSLRLRARVGICATRNGPSHGWYLLHWLLSVLFPFVSLLPLPAPLFLNLLCPGTKLLLNVPPGEGSHCHGCPKASIIHSLTWLSTLSTDAEC